jgi:hypothetical protein
MHLTRIVSAKVKTALVNIKDEINKLCQIIENSNLSDKVKSEATALLRYNILKEHQIRHYNEGCRPDGLN